MAKDRGWYAATYAAQIDSPEWVKLSLNAAAVWWALKNCRDNNRAGIFPVFREMVACRAKISHEAAQNALRELEAERWILMEGVPPGMTWVWLRNHLRYDPTFTPENEKHVKGLIADIEGMPHIGLVAAFVDYYKSLNYLPADFQWKVSRDDSLSMGIVIPFDSQTTPDHSDTTTKTSTKRGARAKPPVATLDSPENRAPIDAYNLAFGANLGHTNGNLQAVARAYADGYTLEQFREVFRAVTEGATPTAEWCKRNNRDFEYLIRPPYRHRRTGETVMGPLDKIRNELASGVKALTQPAQSEKHRQTMAGFRAEIQAGVNGDKRSLLDRIRGAAGGPSGSGPPGGGSEVEGKRLSAGGKPPDR